MFFTLDVSKFVVIAFKLPSPEKAKIDPALTFKALDIPLALAGAVKTVFAFCAVVATLPVFIALERYPSHDPTQLTTYCVKLPPPNNIR